MFAVCMNLCMGQFKRRLLTLTRIAVLALFALVALLVAAGFALSLLYVWLQQIYGTMIALAIVAGGCALLAVILLALAMLRPRRRQHAHVPQPAPTGNRTLDEAITAMQQGSRESMLAALALAVVTGVTLGRKL